MSESDRAQERPAGHEWGTPLPTPANVMDGRGVYRATPVRVCRRCGHSDLSALAFGWPCVPSDHV